MQSYFFRNFVLKNLGDILPYFPVASQKYGNSLKFVILDIMKFNVQVNSIYFPSHCVIELKKNYFQAFYLKTAF